MYYKSSLKHYYYYFCVCCNNYYCLIKKKKKKKLLGPNSCCINSDDLNTAVSSLGHEHIKETNIALDPCHTQSKPKSNPPNDTA